MLNGTQTHFLFANSFYYVEHWTIEKKKHFIISFHWLTIIINWYNLTHTKRSLANHQCNFSIYYLLCFVRCWILSLCDFDWSFFFSAGKMDLQLLSHLKFIFKLRTADTCWTLCLFFHSCVPGASWWITVWSRLLLWLKYYLLETILSIGQVQIFHFDWRKCPTYICHGLKSQLKKEKRKMLCFVYKLPINTFNFHRWMFWQNKRLCRMSSSWSEADHFSNI